MRKLASIVRVKEIREHPNADRLELAIVKGWQVVVQKGEFKPGELAVYFEVDSFLPIHDDYEYLRKSCYYKHPVIGEGFRLRTIKLRKELSQGLLMPMSLLAPYYADENGFAIPGRIHRRFPGEKDLYLTVEEGTDLTEFLKVKKYERPIPANLAGVTKGGFPGFIEKTDQERIQNCWDQIIEMDPNREIQWRVEEKLDGSSCTIYYNESDNTVGVCSRNLELQIDSEENANNTFVQVAKRSGYIDALKKLQAPIAVQGEIIGPGVQGNKYNLMKPELMVFDVYMIDEHRYALPEERQELLMLLVDYDAKVRQVPLVNKRYLPDTIEEVLALSEGNSRLNPKQEREGIVWKSSTLVDGQVVHFKSISNRFLLKGGD